MLTVSAAEAAETHTSNMATITNCCLSPPKVGGQQKRTRIGERESPPKRRAHPLKTRILGASDDILLQAVRFLATKSRPESIEVLEQRVVIEVEKDCGVVMPAAQARELARELRFETFQKWLIQTIRQLFGSKPRLLGQGTFGKVLDCSPNSKMCIKIPTANEEATNVEVNAIRRLIAGRGELRGIVCTMLVEVPHMPPVVLMDKANGSLWSFADKEAVLRSIDDMALDLLHGLDHLHQRDYSHGDLSVSNILLTEEDRLTFKLTDWGSCYHVDTPVEERDTGTTYCALSPEQVGRSGCVRLGDGRWGEICNLPVAYPTDDIWALACAIVFAVTRSLCFHTPGEESSFLNTFLLQCKVLGYPENQQGYSDSWLEILPVLPRFEANGLRLPVDLHSARVQPLIDLCLQRAPARPADAAAVLHFIENL